MKVCCRIVLGYDFLQLLMMVVHRAVGELNSDPCRIAPDDLSGQGYFFGLQSFSNSDGHLTLLTHRNRFTNRKKQPPILIFAIEPVW